MADSKYEVTSFAQLISEGALEIGDGYRAKNEELGGNGLIFLRAGHVTNTHIDFDGVERFREELEPRVRSKVSQVGDAVITTKGNSTGRTAFVTEAMPPFVYSPHLSYWRSKGPNRIESGFLRYWSKSREFVEQLAGMKASTDMAPYLSLIDQKRLKISLPPIEEQRRIAHILGTLDDKIELNRRMNETLEAMARALFKSWFVDFDPVRAKMAGRDPGLPKDIAALFPDRLVESELGEIPAGWRWRQLGELVELTRGTTYKSSLKGLPGPVLLGLASIERHGGFRGDKLQTYGGESPEKLLLKPGDLFVSLKDVTQSADLLGAVARVPSYVKFGRLTQDTVKLSFTSLDVSPEIVYRNLLTPGYREYCRAHATGTTNLALSREDFLAFRVPQATESVQAIFNEFAASIEQRRESAVEETRSLAAIRDVLLPRLLSGEV